MNSKGSTSRDHLRADLVPGRAAGGEDVLDRPLPEGLADDGGGIVQAEQRLDLGDVGLGRGRDDAVDHGRGEGAVGLDPAGERRHRTAPRNRAPGRAAPGRWRGGCRRTAR